MQGKQDEPINVFKIEEEMREKSPRMFGVEKKNQEVFEVIDGKDYYYMDAAWNKAKYGNVNWFTYVETNLDIHKKIYGITDDSIKEWDDKIGEPYTSYLKRTEDLRTKMKYLTQFYEEGKISEEELFKEKYEGFLEVVFPFLDKIGGYPREYRPDDMNELIKSTEEIYEMDRWTRQEETYREVFIERKLANTLEWAINKMEE